ncbi:MAG: histidine triad nucleotide-binding protein [Patescibacteria group bacterium]
MDCVFCKITKKEIPSEVIYEDDQLLAFKDIHPSAPIHYLVVPKEHIQSIAHLEENHSQIISKVIYAAKAVAAQLGMKGYKLVFNVGREGGQVIDHLHLHLLGGWSKKADIEAMPHPRLDK